MADLVGQLAPAPRQRVLGLVDRAAHALDDVGDLLVQIGDLAFGRRPASGRKSVRTYAVITAPLWTPFDSISRNASVATASRSGGTPLAVARRPAAYSAGSVLFRCVERVHHAFDALGDEHLRGIGGAQHRRRNRVALVRLEAAEHVIRKVAADRRRVPRPTRMRGNACVPRCWMTDFSPLCPPAPPSRRARNRPSGSATSSVTMNTSGGLDLVEPRQCRHRLAAQVHERQRLGDDAPARRRPWS